MQTNPISRKGLVVGIILLFVGTAVIPSNAQETSKSSSPTTRGNTLYVGGSGPGNYSRIQDAIDNASDGDSIFIYNGEYEAFIANKTLNIIGESRNDTKIVSDPTTIRIRLLADWINLSNVMVIGTKTSIYPALQTEGNNVTVLNCNIVGGWAGYFGLEIGGSYSHGNYYKSNIRIINCTVKNFSAIGINMQASHHCYVEHCRIYNNDCGIETQPCTYYDSAFYYIYNSDIFANSIGIQLGRRKEFICNCNIYNNSYGIYNYHIQEWTGDQITSCHFTNNSYGCLFDPYAAFDYYTKYTKILGNSFKDNRRGVYFQQRCLENDVYHNNFISSSEYHVADLGNNHWDNGTEGNFWDDYSGSDNNSDGIGDTPYYLPIGNGEDNYPLMHPLSMENVEPNIPTIAGPTDCYQWVEYTFSTNTTDSNYDCIFYKFDWGDDTDSGWVGPFGYWADGTTSHLWKEHGTFNVRVKAKDVKGSESNWSDMFTVNVQNNSYPTEPEVTGPIEGIAGHWITFSVKSTDYDNDQIRYVFDGGEEYTVWTDYTSSGEIVNISYRWGETWYKIEDERIFTLKIRGQDIHGAYGPWYIQDITIFNHPPEKPTIYGPTVGISDKEILFQFTGWDIDNHSLKFHCKLFDPYVDFPDGPCYELWTGYYDCNETYNFSYRFYSNRIFGHVNYILMVQCIDHYGAVGPWSYYNITIKRPFIWFLDWIFERFPNAFPILRYLFEDDGK